MKRIVQVAAIPVVAGIIYSWMIIQIARDARHVLGRRWWPGPPIDFP